MGVRPVGLSVDLPFQTAYAGPGRRGRAGAPQLQAVQAGLGSIDGAILRGPPLPLHALRAVLECQVVPDPDHDPRGPVRALIEAPGSRSNQVRITPRSRALRAHDQLEPSGGRVAVQSAVRPSGRPKWGLAARRGRVRHFRNERLQPIPSMGINPLPNEEDEADAPTDPLG
jgi:hypothetical protein